MVKTKLSLLFDADPSASLASADEAICLFAFIEQPGSVELLGGPLMLHREGAVAALVGVAPVADYCGVEGERHLADVAWLAPRVQRHAEIIEWAMERSSVFPVPFGTLYSSLASLTMFMRAHEAAIIEFFRAVADKEEWELRATAKFDSPETLDELACSAWPDWRELPKGARYMRLCRDRNALIEFGRAEAAAFMRDFVAKLWPLTADVRQHDVSHRIGSGEAEPVARYALLLSKANVAAVRARIEEIADGASCPHIAIALSGPWPPFSFRPHLKSTQ
jgi:Gas vesicle synthesis protein GvpL/GvpF